MGTIPDVAGENHRFRPYRRFNLLDCNKGTRGGPILHLEKGFLRFSLFDVSGTGIADGIPIGKLVVNHRLPGYISHMAGGKTGPTTRINELYQSLLNGQQTAEADLFEILTVRFRVLAYLRTGNEADAEEVVQDALLVIAEQHREIKFEASFGSWAYAVLDNRLRKYYRGRQQRRKRQIVLNPVEEDRIPTAWTPNPDLERGLKECLKRLEETNPKYAQVLMLNYQGYGQDEICMKLGISRENLYVILHRARARLKRCLEKRGAI